MHPKQHKMFHRFFADKDIFQEMRMSSASKQRRKITRFLIKIVQALAKKKNKTSLDWAEPSSSTAWLRWSDVLSYWVVRIAWINQCTHILSYMSPCWYWLVVLCLYNQATVGKTRKALARVVCSGSWDLGEKHFGVTFFEGFVIGWL